MFLQASVAQESYHGAECSVHCLQGMTSISKLGKAAPMITGTGLLSSLLLDILNDAPDSISAAGALLFPGQQGDQLPAQRELPWRAACKIAKQDAWRVSCLFRLQRSVPVRSKTREVRLSMGMKQRTGRGCLGAGAAGHASDILSALSQMRACIAIHHKPARQGDQSIVW